VVDAQKRIVSFTRGGTVCEQVTLAQTPFRRMVGLLGRTALPQGEGMLLRPEKGIHTAFMRFPIDAVFLGPDMEVLEIFSELRPFRVAATRGAYAVLELAAGEASRRELRVGDRLGVVDRGFVESSQEWDVTDAADDEAMVFPPSADFALPPHEHSNGTRPAPMRVLLIAHDRRFRTVGSALLARRGCAVTTTVSATRVVPLVERDRIDVVVLDTGALLTEAARTAAMIEALTPSVGVVLVAEEAEVGLDHLPVLAKWGAFEAIFEAIEQADRDRGRRSRLVG
jgi:uncharacterized membrane protein (UPF0127 family)/CheY-like chemotaxis protein